jgi:benzylsuccinate CoA-transferase BbsF subunit
MGNYVSEYMCGLSSATATLAALYHSLRTGRGQFVDISKQEALIFCNLGDLIIYPAFGFISDRITSAFPVQARYRCKDGYVAFTPLRQEHWAIFFKVVQKPDGIKDERLGDFSYLEEHRHEIKQIAAEYLLKCTKEEIQSNLRLVKCPLAPYLTIGEAVNAEQMRHRHFFVDIEHRKVGKLKYPSAPYQFSQICWKVRRAAPLLGEHNDEVLHSVPSHSHVQEKRHVSKGSTSRAQQKKVDVSCDLEGRPGVLDGIRVLEFSQVFVGPVAGEILAHMGAEVIKVESRRHLDFGRLQRNPITKKMLPPDEAPRFNSLNLDKVGITLDINKPKGADLARKLVAKCDVLLENLAAGTLDRLGLGYEVLCQINPKIIMVSATGSGQSGPDSQSVAVANTFTALSGLGEMIGYPDEPPTQAGSSADLINSFGVCFSIIVALYNREHTGKGQYIDYSCREGLMCTIGDSIMDYTMNSREQIRHGNHDDVIAPHNCYRCKGDDSWVSLVVSNEDEWQDFCRAIGNPSWTREERFSSMSRRWKNRDELDQLIQNWTMNYTSREVMEILQSAGVAAIPSFTSAELFSDPHLAARNFFQTAEHPLIGATF